MKLFIDVVRATLSICACCLLIQAVSNAQSSRERGRSDSAASARALEVRLEKAEEALVNEYKEVVVEFYKQGDKEKAMSMLSRLRQLNPELDGLDERIDSISEELMQENAREFEIDTRKTWEYAGDILKDKAFRIAAAGDFKLTFTATVTVDGMVTEKESRDYLPKAPLGCLIGVIVASDGKPGQPFPVKSELEMTAKSSGKLFLKVNVPEGTRCTGKIKVQVSGYIQAAGRS